MYFVRSNGTKTLENPRQRKSDFFSLQNICFTLHVLGLRHYDLVDRYDNDTATFCHNHNSWL